MSDELPVNPTWDDPAVGPLSESVGGPLGARSAGHRFWTPVRVILALTAIFMALAIFQKQPCYSNGWVDPLTTSGDSTNLRYTHMCYTDLPYLYTGRGMAELAWPYTSDPTIRSRYEVMEYPVGISYWAWATAEITQLLRGSPSLAERAAVEPGALWGGPVPVDEVSLYVVVNAVGFALLALLAAWLLAGVNRRRPWDAVFFACSPALLFTGLINWDMLAVVCVAGILWAWARSRPVLAGALIGLGTAVKLYPLFLLGGILIICWRRNRWRELATVICAAAVTWLVVNLPALLSSSSAWGRFWSFNSERPADLGSIWLIIGDGQSSYDTINMVSWLFFGAWCFGVLLLGLLAPTAPRLAQLGFLIVAGFLIINKVYSPQYVLWLLPLAVLARPRLRDLAIWQVSELVYFASVWWYLAGYLAPGGGGPDPYHLAILLRIAGELFLVAVVVRDILRPNHDPVREFGWFAHTPRTPATRRKLYADSAQDVRRPVG